jgi:hypothetical protein
MGKELLSNRSTDSRSSWISSKIIQILLTQEKGETIVSPFSIWDSEFTYLFNLIKIGMFLSN